LWRAAIIGIILILLLSTGTGIGLGANKVYSSSNLKDFTGEGQAWGMKTIYKLISSDTPYQNNVYRVGFVEPLFSYAAYQNNSFYTFYNQHYDDDVVRSGDIDLLVDNKLPTGPFFLHNHQPDKPPTIPWIKYFTTLKENFEKVVPQARVNVLSDVDIHHGRVFHTANGSNAYDILFLFHSEYLTQEEYNNLKQFVSNGGTIVFTEANALLAEIKYDELRDSITFVKGHRWEFDGKTARKGIAERWQNDSREWVGSNFISTKPVREDIKFLNLPFMYNHTEEQHITNPNATIIHDYGIYDPTDEDFNVTSALYEMKSGKGKVLGSSIYGHSLTDNVDYGKFLKLFDYIMVPYSLRPDYYRLVNDTQDVEGIPVHSILRTGEVDTIEVDKQSQVISLNFSQPQLQEDNLVIFIPHSIISPIPNTAFDGTNETYVVTTDGGKKLNFDYISLDLGTGFNVSLPSGATSVQISYETPSFSLDAPKDISLEAKGKYTEFNVGTPTISCLSENKSGCIENLIVRNDALQRFPIGTTYITWTALDPLSNLSARSVQKVSINDTFSPNIMITDPPSESIIYSNASEAVIELAGNTNDSAGIAKVEAYAYDLPLVGDDTTYQEAKLVSEGNWSRWSITLRHPINGTEVGVTARVTDHGGNQEWAKGKYIVFQTKTIR
jgi:hypothetical protein